jgi:hypothetical protein
MLFKSIREHAGSTGNLAGLNPGWRRVAKIFEQEFGG